MQTDSTPQLELFHPVTPPPSALPHHPWPECAALSTPGPLPSRVLLHVGTERSPSALRGSRHGCLKTSPEQHVKESLKQSFCVLQNKPTIKTMHSRVIHLDSVSIKALQAEWGSDTAPQLSPSYVGGGHPVYLSTLQFQLYFHRCVVNFAEQRSTEPYLLYFHTKQDNAVCLSVCL